MIEVLLLRYALAAADSGSFSRAAERFRVKQSTLSKQIRYLEQRLGLSLFARSNQGVVLTAGGRQFLARARSIVGELDQLSAESTGFANGRYGILRVGFHASLTAGDLRAILAAYRAEYPDVVIEAFELDRARLLERLDRGSLDLGIVAGEAGGSSRRSLSLWSEPLMIGVPAEHTLLSRERLYWTDLIGLEFMVTSGDPGALIAAMIASRLTGPGHSPRVTTQAVSRENLHCFASPTCLTVTAGATIPGAGIALREIHDAFGSTRLEQCLVWRADNASPALAGLLALVGRRYGRSL